MSDKTVGSICLESRTTGSPVGPETLQRLWREHPGQPAEVKKDGGKKMENSGCGKTVSSICLVSLTELSSLATNQRRPLSPVELEF